MRRERGFTLLELVVTVTIASILAGIAIPYYLSFVRNEREVTQANSLVFALNYARGEAVKRDSVICLCPSTDGANCAAATSWSTGWIVHIPAASTDCTTPSTAANSILQSSVSLNPNSTTQQSSATVTSAQSGVAVTGCVGAVASCAASPSTGTALTSVSFQTSGLIASNNGAGSGVVMFKFCDPRGTPYSLDVELTPSGRPEASSTQAFAVNGTTQLSCP